MPFKGWRAPFTGCIDCGETDIAQMRKTSYRGRGYGNRCNPCYRKKYPYPLDKSKGYHLKRKYGLTPEQIDARLAEQQGLCALCGKPPDGTDQHKRLVVDHDHHTGAFRGLVHGRCNTLLGDCQEDEAVLLAAIAYLRRNKI